MPHERKHGGSQGEQLGELKSAALEAVANAIAITDQSRMEEQAFMLVQAVQNSSDLIGIGNCAGKFTFVNEAVLKMTGRQPEELIGKHFGTILSPNNPAPVVEDIATKSLESEGWKGDCILLRHDETDFIVFLNVGPIKDKEGRVIGMFGIARDISERKEKEDALREAHKKLNVALAELKNQAQDAAKLSELVDMLQSCQNSEQAYEVTANALQGILRSTAGALCITSPSRDIVEVVGSWGNAPASEKAFRPDDCWALRRGKVHRVKDPASPLRCGHVSKSLANGYVCVPLAAQGETLGVLYAENVSEPAGSAMGAGPDQTEVLERQATAVGERISLALANLRLREVLRGQSIRDPLTSLFNRRFMEESLGRELRRAMRGKQQVALVMLDIPNANEGCSSQQSSLAGCALKLGILPLNPTLKSDPHHGGAAMRVVVKRNSDRYCSETTTTGITSGRFAASSSLLTEISS